MSQWCRWCGDDLTSTHRGLGPFCGVSCLREYHADAGGYAWALDLLGISEQRGRELDEPNGTHNGMTSRKGTA